MDSLALISVKSLYNHLKKGIIPTRATPKFKLFQRPDETIKAGIDARLS